MSQEIRKVSTVLESTTDSPQWFKNKKCTINSKNENDDTCFKDAATATLATLTANQEKTGKKPRRINTGL